MNILGIGKIGSAIAEKFKSYPQYKVFKIYSDAAKASNEYLLEDKQNPEDYESLPIITNFKIQSELDVPPVWTFIGLEDGRLVKWDEKYYLIGVRRDTKDVLVRFIILVFTALVALFIVDKVIAFRIKLLPEDTNKELFDLIKTLILMIFSYYFGTKNSSKEN